MPTLEKIEITRRAKVRRAKLNYLRNLIGKRAMLRGELLPPGFGQPTEQEEEAAKAKVAEEAAGDEGSDKEAAKDDSGEKVEENKDAEEATEDKKEEEKKDE